MVKRKKDESVLIMVGQGGCRLRHRGGFLSKRPQIRWSQLQARCAGFSVTPLQHSVSFGPASHGNLFVALRLRTSSARSLIPHVYRSLLCYKNITSRHFLFSEIGYAKWQDAWREKNPATGRI